jgi:hypothetical protein
MCNSHGPNPLSSGVDINNTRTEPRSKNHNQSLALMNALPVQAEKFLSLQDTPDFNFKSPERGTLDV